MAIEFKINLVGYPNKGAHPLTENSKGTKAYKTWYSMMERCYANRSTALTYSDCIVVEDWRYFQNFASWFHKNYRDGYQLDKDILVKGNKIYGPDTCIFVPQELNCLLTDHLNARGLYPQGVSRVSTPTPSFQAKLSKQKKQCYLGSFRSIEKAFDAYKRAKEVYVKEVALRHFELGNIGVLTFKALQKWEL